MTLEQALAILVIAAFAAFIIWGRSREGQAALEKVFGSPPPRAPRSPKAVADKTRRTSRTAASKTGASTTRRASANRAKKR